jgi:WD40 repeat protein
LLILAITLYKTSAIATSGHGVELWNLQTRERIRVLGGDGFGVVSIAFSPDGKTVIAGTDGGEIKVWSIE